MVLILTADKQLDQVVMIILFHFRMLFCIIMVKLQTIMKKSWSCLKILERFVRNSWKYGWARQNIRLKYWVLSIWPQFLKIWKWWRMVQKFPLKSSRKTKSCWCLLGIRDQRILRLLWKILRLMFGSLWPFFIQMRRASLKIFSCNVTPFSCY